VFDVHADTQPTMSSLILHGPSDLCQLLISNSSPAQQSALTEFRLFYANLDPGVIQNAIRSPWFSTLKVLHVQQVGSTHGGPSCTRPWERFEFDRLTVTMAKYLPNLEHMLWQGIHNHLESGEKSTFGSFAQQKQLKVLVMDYDLFAEPTMFDGRRCQLPTKHRLETFFPAECNTLVLSSIGWLFIHSLYHSIVTNDDDGNDDAELGRLSYAAQLVASLPLRSIKLVVSMADWPHDEDDIGPFGIQESAIDALRIMADTLSQTGTTLGVEYLLQPDDTIRPLVGPNFNATEIYYEVYLDVVKATEASLEETVVGEGQGAEEKSSEAKPELETMERNQKAFRSQKVMEKTQELFKPSRLPSCAGLTTIPQRSYGRLCIFQRRADKLSFGWKYND